MDTIILRDLGITLKAELPDFFGNKTTHEATWMRQVLKEVFEMGFGTTIWLVYLKDGIVEPLSCTMGVTEDECKVLDFGKSLNIPQIKLTEKILQRRAEKFYAEHK